MAKPLGYILDEFNSPIDNSPCVAILTLKSSNRKTGNMAQVWILRSDINPVEALNIGADYSICGNCPHRKGENQLIDDKLVFIDKGERSCYVNAGQAPNSVYKAYKAGKYADLTDPAIMAETNLSVLLNGRKIRWGAYGDPAIMDPDIVNEFNLYAAGHTGYTHQWRQDFAEAFKGVFQASCDGFNDYMVASDKGWRTFSVVPKGYKPNKIKICPATVANSQATCMTCSLCDGSKKDIYVEAHGTGGKYVLNIA